MTTIAHILSIKTRLGLPLRVLSLLCVVAVSSCNSSDGLVHSVAEFNQAVKQAQAGDKIILANGVWKDTELVFTGEGTEDQPITLSVEEKGKVSLEGQSNIRIAGTHLIVEGLVFKNGYTPTSEVISFRRNKEHLANHCRVTECVIDNYSNPERFESDYWVGIYGKHNRFDHNYLTGKRNQGVTLAVRLNTEESRENHNLVDHNYFGHRPILGSNGGETLRVGTSHYSLTNSNTIVEYNYFDRCNGEHEIISNKACQNTYRYNTFYECQGTLTMRHGNETLVEENYFFGNGESNTGGIRIINETQTVINNYCEGLTGYRFRGALVIMNGVPNSPANRYFQVKDSRASNNTFIDCDHIQLCAGSDEERSAVPINTVVSNNLFYHRQKENLFTIYDDISGISFDNNLLSPQMKPFQKVGFFQQEVAFETNQEGVQIPTTDPALEVGMKKTQGLATPENTGVSWYPRREEEIRFNTGTVIPVNSGENTLAAAVANSHPGDIIELQEAGEYIMTKSIDLHHPLSFVVAAGVSPKPRITFQKTTLFNIENGGALSLHGVLISGSESRDKPGNAVIRTSRYSMNRNYKLFIEDCDFVDLDVNHSFDVVKVFKNTFADSVVLRNSRFENITGIVLGLDKETDDIGIYNAENVVIDNCLFSNIEGAALTLHRGGRDESTFGPMLTIDHCTFDNIGDGKRNRTGSAIHLHGVQEIDIRNSIFRNSEEVEMFLAVGEPVVSFSHCNFDQSIAIESNDDAYQEINTSRHPVSFEEGFSLEDASPLKGKGHDGKDVGYLK
ncbi:MAG: chondroitinase-B domain-containing protein [Bacteroidota bacterium]